MPKLLFVTTMPFYPDSSGGAQLSSLYLFKSLCQLGWQVEVICGLTLRSSTFRQVCWQTFSNLRKPSAALLDNNLGYPCWRRLLKFTTEQQWLEWLDERLKLYQPDVVLGQNTPDCPLLGYCASQGYPSFYFVRSLTCLESGSVIPEGIYPIANSPCAASFLSKFTHKDVPVVLPFLDVESYRVAQRNRKYITFINPIPKKGVEIVIEAARRLPQERFLFVKGKWSIYKKEQLEAFIEPAYSLPNVEIWEHQSDMQRVYAVTDILLAPSQFTETFGRVIVEAQVNGIPVVAAKIGGIPYTIGEGGITVELPDQAEGYVEALQKLRTNQSFYEKLSAQAIQNSQRPEFDPQQQVKNFIEAVERYCLV